MSESFEPLLADGVIEAVLGQLKAGKEAEVWLVQHQGEIVAAKVYKERHARNFRNNAGYKEGREVRNSRTRRAMEKGSRFGQEASEEAWKDSEADAIHTLHARGVRVPAPVLYYEGILLMELLRGPDGGPAPRLVEAPPRTADEATAMYADLRQQVVRMLAADLIHGDLSPYNVLVTGKGPTLIDFPQTIAAARNNRAEMYFRRDLDNLRDFFARIDPRLHQTHGETSEIWDAYLKRELHGEFVPSGRRQPAASGEARAAVRRSADGRGSPPLGAGTALAAPGRAAAGSGGGRAARARGDGAPPGRRRARPASGRRWLPGPSRLRTSPPRWPRTWPTAGSSGSCDRWLAIARRQALRRHAAREARSGALRTAAHPEGGRMTPRALG